MDDTEKLVNLSKTITTLSEAYSTILSSERSQNMIEADIDKLLSEVIKRTTAFVEKMSSRDPSSFKGK